jgi:hypothetical protein
VPVLPLQARLQVEPALQVYEQLALAVFVQLKSQLDAAVHVAVQASLLPSGPSTTPLQPKLQSC